MLDSKIGFYMKWRHYILYFTLCISTNLTYSQYKFTGYVDPSNKDNNIYLSLIEDYRKMSGVYPDQIIHKVTPDSSGYFMFEGNNLPLENRIYRIHTENCKEKEEAFHFNGICTNSNEILFVANNNDSISLPLTEDQEVFCQILSKNEDSNAFIKVDSIIRDMRFAFSTYRSQANSKINSKKWVTTLQEYGTNSREPLTELYIYSFLSNKSNSLYKYYLQDLQNNTYYNDLLNRLAEKYPNSSYTKQYEIELAADKFSKNISKKRTPYAIWILCCILLVSIIINVFQYIRYKKIKTSSKKTIDSLTQQEKKILNLILENKTNKEMASLLFVSLSTIKTHINNIYKKIGIDSREEVKSLFKK